MDPHKTKPLLEKLPNSNGEAKMHKNMVVGLRDLLAKGAKSTIWLPAVLQPIGGPKTVLENKLSVVLYFWRAPSFPHNRVHIRVHEAKELSFVGRGCGVLAILRELPRDIVFHLLI
jgi:hypothetical protein